MQNEEIAKGIATWNIPGFQANRELVAFPDGGLYNPVALTFDPSLNTQDFSKPIEHFKYPVLEDVKRPESDDDLAFMTVTHPVIIDFPYFAETPIFIKHFRVLLLLEAPYLSSTPFTMCLFVQPGFATWFVDKIQASDFN